MLKMTKNVYEANLVTHGGKFHADEVFATAFLSTIIDNPVVCRVLDVPTDLKKDVLVYDVGYGEFDHHMKDFNLRHASGVKYASFGLIFKKYGMDYLRRVDEEYAEMVFTMLEKELVEGIDAVDNGEFPVINAPYVYRSLDTIIGDFNCCWNEEVDNDIYFKQAVDIALMIFAATVKKCFAKASAKKIVDEAIEKSTNHIMVLDKHLPFKDFVITSSNPKANDILFVITPSNRNGYNINTIPKSKDTYLTRCDFPKEWGGLIDDDLQRVSGIKSAIFCHKTLFLAVCGTLDDAYLMAQKAILENFKNKNNN